MNYKILDEIINIPISLFEEKERNEHEYNKLASKILVAEVNLSEELSNPLTGTVFQLNWILPKKRRNLQLFE